MAKKLFSWSNFTYAFIKGIVYNRETPARLQPRYLYEECDFDFLIPYANRICSYPNESFVRRYRKVIEDYFLNGSNHLVQVVKRLESLNYGGIHLGTNEDMLFALRQKKMTQTLCDAYLGEIRMTGTTVYDDEDSLFRVPKTIDLSETVSDAVPLYPYQEKAVDAMRRTSGQLTVFATMIGKMGSMS